MNDPATPREPTTTWEREALRDLLNEHLKARRSARRWRWFKTLVLLTLVAALGYWLWRDTGGHIQPTAAHTAVVVVEGTIESGGDASADAIIQAMREAFEAPNSQAVVLLFNSPGGSPVQAGIVNDEIVRLRALYDKPVYAVVEDMCASAAYYIAAGADAIYVDKASVVGSIGVLMDGFGFTELMGKIGVERRLLTAGENKGFLDPFSEQSAAQKAHAQALLSEIHQQFIATVRQGRGPRLRETPETFSGLFWTGERAVQMGLADGLGSLDSVARDVVKASDIVDYTIRDNLQERLVKQLGASIGSAVVNVAKATGWQLR